MSLRHAAHRDNVAERGPHRRNQVVVVVDIVVVVIVVGGLFMSSSPRQGVQRLAWLLEGSENKNETSIRNYKNCLLYTSPSPRDKRQSRMPSSA